MKYLRLFENYNERDSYQFHRLGIHPEGKVYQVGDIIDGSELSELSGDMGGGIKGEQYKLIQQDISIFPDDEYNLEALVQQEGEEYRQEEMDRIESMKEDFDKVPPIPEEGDGFHRIVTAKILGHKTILMWKRI